MAAVANHQYLTSLGQSAEQILSKNYKSIKAAQNMRKSLERSRDQVLNRFSSETVPITIVYPEILSDLTVNLKVCQDNITESGEKEIIDRLAKDHTLLEEHLGKTNPAESVHDVIETTKSLSILSAHMIDILDELVAINERAMEIAEQNTKNIALQAQRNAAILFVITIIVIMTISYLLSYRIAIPVMALAQGLAEASEKSGFYPQVSAWSNDEIGFLTRSFNLLFQRLEQHDNYRDDVLAAEKDKVVRVEEAKSRFVAEISHQIKTPMTSLSMSVGMLHDMRDRLAEDKRIRLIDTAYDDCMRLSALINELVDMTRLEVMAKPRPKETLDIITVIQECISPLIKQAEEKNIAVKIEAQENLPPVTIDSFRFPWVFTNLLGNALRYTTPGGEVRFTARKQGSRLYFTCTDTGSGIDPDYIPRIFDRYTQFADREKSGTIGLGLAIVKDIIEQHGGDIQVSSQIGKGTRFTFWIPTYMEDCTEEGTGN